MAGCANFWLVVGTPPIFPVGKTLGGRGEGLDQNIYGGSYEPSRDEPSRGITVVV